MWALAAAAAAMRALTPRTGVVEVGRLPGVTDAEARELEALARRLGLGALRAASVTSYRFDPPPAAERPRAPGRRRCWPTPPSTAGRSVPLPAGAFGEGDGRAATTSTRVEPVPSAGSTTRAWPSSAGRRLLSLDVGEMPAIQRHFAGEGREPDRRRAGDAGPDLVGALPATRRSGPASTSPAARPRARSTERRTIDGLLASHLRAATDAVDRPWVRSAFVDNAGIVALRAGRRRWAGRRRVRRRLRSGHQGRDPQPPLGPRALRRGQHRRRRRRAGRDRRLGPARSPASTCSASPPPPRRPTRRARGRAAPPAGGRGGGGRHRRLRQQAGPAHRGRRRRLPPRLPRQPAGLLRRGRRPAPRLAPQPARSPATWWSWSAAAPGGTASTGPRSPRPTWSTDDGHGGGQRRADRRPDHREAGAGAGRGGPGPGPLPRHHRLRGRRAVLGGGRAGRRGGRRGRPGRRAPQVPRPAALGGLAVGVAGADGAGRAPSGLAPSWSSWPRRWSVEATAIGRLTGDGRLRVDHGARTSSTCPWASSTTAAPAGTWWPSGRTRLAPVRGRRRRRRAPATSARRPGCSGCWPTRRWPPRRRSIRTYDHEVRGGTLVRPWCGPAGDGPTDGAVCVPLGHWDRGGPSPWPSASTPATAASTPTAWRSRRWTRCSATWWPWAPTPTGWRCSTTSAGATRPCPTVWAGWCGPRRAATTPPLAYRAPFVSGKDSLFNEFEGRPIPRHAADHRARPGGPTAATPDSAAPRAAGQVVYLVGETRPRAGRLAAAPSTLGHAERRARCPASARGPRSPATGRCTGPSPAGLVVAAHDPSEGGLAVALAELASPAGSASTVDVPAAGAPRRRSSRRVAVLRVQRPVAAGRSTPATRPRCEAALAGLPLQRLGTADGAPAACGSASARARRRRRRPRRARRCVARRTRSAGQDRSREPRASRGPPRPGHQPRRRGRPGRGTGRRAAPRSCPSADGPRRLRRRGRARRLLLRRRPRRRRPPGAGGARARWPASRRRPPGARHLQRVPGAGRGRTPPGPLRRGATAGG